MTARFSAILADLDGTVNRGAKLLPKVRQAHADLARRGIKWLFLSNNASKAPHEIARGIIAMGLDIDPAQVITSATALIEHIAAHKQGSRFMIIGGPTLAGAVEEAGGVTTENPAETEIVVTSLDTSFNYEKLKSAHLALQNKALFWATNLDPSVPMENGFHPGAGSIAAALSTAAGRGPSVVFGKPHPFMADIALQRLGLSREDCLIVGDRMDTDILFAKNAGISSVLTLTGAARKDDLSGYSFQPDYVVEDMSGLIEIVG